MTTEEKDEPRHVHVDLSKTGDRTGVVVAVVKPLVCCPCGGEMLQGDPCPDCGRQLLLD